MRVREDSAVSDCNDARPDPIVLVIAAREIILIPFVYIAGRNSEHQAARNCLILID